MKTSKKMMSLERYPKKNVDLHMKTMRRPMRTERSKEKKIKSKKRSSK